MRGSFVPKRVVSENEVEEFDFPQKVDETEEDNPFHYVQNKGGNERARRRSSFAGTGFEKLASTQEEELDLEDFFTSEKLFLIFTNAGKPVYSS